MQKPQSSGVPGSVGDRKTAAKGATLSSVGGSWCATCAARLEPRQPNSRAECPPPVPPWGEARLTGYPVHQHRLRNSATGIRLGGFHHLRDNFRFLLVFLPLTNTRISGTIELRRTGKPFKRQSTPSCLERGILFNGCRHFTTAEPPFSRGFFYWCSFFTTFSAISSANSSISAELAQALETLPPVIISEKAYNIVVESLSC